MCSSSHHQVCAVLPHWLATSWNQQLLLPLQHLYHQNSTLKQYTMLQQEHFSLLPRCHYHMLMYKSVWLLHLLKGHWISQILVTSWGMGYLYCWIAEVFWLLYLCTRILLPQWIHAFEILNWLCEGTVRISWRNSAMAIISCDLSSFKNPITFSMPSDFSLEAASCSKWSQKAGYPSRKCSSALSMCPTHRVPPAQVGSLMFMLRHLNAFFKLVMLRGLFQYM